MKKVWVLLLVLIIALGLIACDKNKTISKTEGIQTESMTDYINGEANSQLSESDLPRIDTSISDVLVEAGYSVEHATEIQGILNTIGITQIEIENTTGEAETGLNAVICYPNAYTDRNRRFYFTTEDGVLFYAGFGDEDLYDVDQGGFLKSYGDVYVPETKVDLDTYQTLRDYTESVLDGYFIDASYYDAWGIGRSDDDYMMQCQAYARNGLGVRDWVFAKVWYHYENEEYEVVGVSIDGVLYDVK